MLISPRRLRLMRTQIGFFSPNRLHSGIGHGIGGMDVPAGNATRNETHPLPYRTILDMHRPPDRRPCSPGSRHCIIIVVPLQMIRRSKPCQMFSPHEAFTKGSPLAA